MSEFRTFRDLECWKACRELRLFVAKQILPALPRDEKYRLGDQTIRAEWGWSGRCYFVIRES